MRVLDSASATHPEQERAGRGQSLKVFAIRILTYLTNEVVASVPSYRLRRAWYRRILGIEIQPEAAIQLHCYIWFYSPGSIRRNHLLRIGRHTLINRRCCLDARGSLTIGDNVSVSAEVTILTAQHLVGDPAFRVVMQPVEIQDHVWIGMRAMILPGVTVGRGAVIAAGAVVTRNVAPLDIVAGVPAVPIGRRTIEPAYQLDRPPLFE
jgi:maltose O-acetyltransferase